MELISGLVLDTNAVSAIADAETSIAKFFKHEGDICIPVVVMGEYRFGISQSRRKADCERWLEAMISSCRILDITDETASWYARLRLQQKTSGKPIPSNDLWIAALCRQHSLPILSRDRHFDVVTGLTRITW
ncbi:MAG: type II toxin-antitoxin system VapC family toxin [Acidobacteria bacterium]|nr:type II toxin-antitoxin system VapC family toxin [Acidobacteriota bacterium]